MFVNAAVPVIVSVSVRVSVSVSVIVCVPVIVRVSVRVIVFVIVVVRVTVVVAVLVHGCARVVGVVSQPSRRMRCTAMAAPKPLSMFTTRTPEAQLVSIANRAVKPPMAVP